MIVVAKWFGFGNSGDSAGDLEGVGRMVTTVAEELVACW